MTENEIAKIVFETSLELHRNYGPGMFESVYEEILSYELAKKSLYIERQKPIPVIHEEIKMEVGFRADLIVENKVIVELKSVEELAKVHYKQVITYLKLTNYKLGLLINFNVDLLKDGFHRIVNGL
ncbi:GxxExxY protein [Arachidicoccus ginsenosidimutans]|uniref:GxxExxY protein n=1 Tax=Arachidicoccus sp. BS20 TaxID=1850526 RepID=UPI0007F0E43D|nr:GxxExxY protein [Arachidicoccus sp. BS20]ANI90191.1 GxxExxY protein [Arachidicoccus sp. BS20]